MVQNYGAPPDGTAGSAESSPAVEAIPEGAFCSLEPDNGSDKPPC